MPGAPTPSLLCVCETLSIRHTCNQQPALESYVVTHHKASSDGVARGILMESVLTPNPTGTTVYCKEKVEWGKKDKEIGQGSRRVPGIQSPGVFVSWVTVQEN